MGERDDIHSCVAGDRFDRIENWLAKLAGHIEEITKLIIETRTNKETIQDHEDRLRLLEKAVVQNTQMAKWVERFIWLLVATAVYFLRQGG